MPRLRTLAEVIKYVGYMNLTPLLRRYLILGAFDGIVLAVSVIIPLYSLHTKPETVLLTAVGGLLGISISSAFNSLIVESEERRIELKNLERQLMKRLDGTVYDYGAKVAITLSALVHGLSPLLGFIPVLTDIYLGGIVGLLLSITSLALTLTALGLVYEGGMREKLRASLIMVIAGFMSAGLVYAVAR